MREFFACASPPELCSSLEAKSWNVPAACDAICTHGTPSAGAADGRHCCRSSRNTSNTSSARHACKEMATGTQWRGCGGKGGGAERREDSARGSGGGNPPEPVWFGNVAREVTGTWHRMFPPCRAKRSRPNAQTEGQEDGPTASQGMGSCSEAVSSATSTSTAALAAAECSAKHGGETGGTGDGRRKWHTTFGWKGGDLHAGGGVTAGFSGGRRVTSWPNAAPYQWHSCSSASVAASGAARGGGGYGEREGRMREDRGGFGPNSVRSGPGSANVFRTVHGVMVDNRDGTYALSRRELDVQRIRQEGRVSGRDGGGGGGGSGRVGGFHRQGSEGIGRMAPARRREDNRAVRIDGNGEICRGRQKVEKVSGAARAVDSMDIE